MVIWIIGMSASGKTTIGKKLYDKLNASAEKWIFLDGDTFRNILDEDLGHSVEDRKKNAYRISRFCEFLDSQGINVVACVLSIFHDNQQYNKDNIVDYKEVYIDVEFNELVRRDNKELYSKALKGNIKNVVGVDIEFKPPFSPDLVINNNKSNPNFEKIINKIIEKFNINLDDKYEYTKNNLLKKPHKYQYSKFEGEVFFKKIITDRKESLKFFEERMKYLNEKNNKSDKLGYDYYVNNSSLVLKNFLLHILQDNNELKKQKDIVLLLVKRFEVGKKLYTTYDIKDIRKNTVNFDDKINYPLFSLVLGKYYNLESNAEEKLIYLNAILKVNDIISSIRADMILPIELEYSISAIELELKMMREYI